MLPGSPIVYCVILHHPDLAALHEDMQILTCQECTCAGIVKRTWPPLPPPPGNPPPPMPPGNPPPMPPGKPPPMPPGNPVRDGFNEGVTGCIHVMTRQCWLLTGLGMRFLTFG